MKLKKLLTDAQLTGVLIMITGLIYEVFKGAHWGWVIFTTGSLYFTLATKIKYYKKMRKR